jgi:hypothetical protein
MFDKDFSGARLLGGQAQRAPDIILVQPNGDKHIFPQVLVSGIADAVLGQLAAFTARVTVTEMLGALEDAGLIPPGTLQKYTEGVPSSVETKPESEKTDA